GGRKVGRTLKVFNDTRFDDPIDVEYKLNVGGKDQGGSWQVKLKPGTTGEKDLTLDVPEVKERSRGELTLTCSRGGKEGFREVKELWVVPADAGPRPAVDQAGLVVLDPKGTVKDRLMQRGIAFSEAESFDKLPAKAAVVVVGPSALSPREA